MQIVASAFNQPMNEQVIRQFIAQYKPIFPVGWNTQVAVYAYAQHSILSQRPLYVPHLVFIDRQGVIQRQVRGEDSEFHTHEVANIKKTLDQLLAASAPPAKKAAPKKKK